MEEKDYASEIFEQVEFDNPDFNITDFKSRIQSDETFLVNLYDTLGGMDETFKERMDGNTDDEKYKTFRTRILDFSTTSKGKDEKDEVVEADETVTSIDTDIPTTPGEVNAKYDPYLELLLKDTKDAITLENLNLDQTIAKDNDGNPLVGQELLDHVLAVENDKKKLLLLVDTQKDEIDYAQELKNIQLKTIPTREEVLAKVAEGGKGTDSYAKTDIIQGDASNSLLMNLVKREKDENFEGFDLPNQMNLSNLANIQQQRQAEAKEQEEDPFNLASSMQSETTLQPKINLDNQSGLNLSVGEVQDAAVDNFEQNYKETHFQLKRGAESLGLKVTSDKAQAEKNPEKYFYLPTLTEAKQNPDIIEDIKYNEEVFNESRFLTNREKIASERINSKEIRKQLDEVLENFEGEKGVSGWNNVVNAYASLMSGFGVGKHLMEKSLGLTIDDLLGMKEGSREAYKENQEQLADAIGLSQKGDDFKIAAVIHQMRNQANSLLAEEANLRKLQQEIENNPYRTQEDIDKFKAFRDELILTQKQIQANYEYLGDLTFEGTNVQEILEKTKKSYDQLNVLENIFLNSGVRIATGLAAINNEMSYVNLLEFAGINLRDENVRQQYGDYVEDIFGETVGNIAEGGLDLLAYKDKKADEMISGMAAFGEGLLNEVKEQQRFDEIETAMDGLMWGTEMLTGQLLNTGMSIVIPGGGGLIISAMAESGNQMYDMKKRMEGVEWSDKEKAYIQEFKQEFGYNPLGDDDTYKVKPEEINALQFYGTAGIYGVAEYASERITLGNFKMGAKNLRKAFDLSKTKGVVSSNKINQRWINLRESSRDFIKGVPGESFGEGAVTLSQNFAEKYILGNQDVSLLDGMTESMMSGLVMSGTMQGPGLMAQTYQAFRGPDRNARIAQRGDDILKLSNNIKANELKLAGLKPNSDSFKNLQEAIQLESAQLHKLAMEQLADQSKVRNEILSYTKGDRQSLIDIFNKEHRLRRQIDKYNDNTAISAESAKASIVELQNELLRQEAKKKYILGNAEWNADKQRANRFANAYRAKNGTLNKVETVVADNNSQALENGLAYVDTLNDLTQEEKNQVKSQMKDQFAEADRASIGPKGEKYSINGFAWGDNLTVETTNPDGTKSTRKVDLPMTFSIKSTALSEGGNITVQSHEVGHHTLFKQFMENNPDAVGLVNDLEAYVKKNYKKAYDAFLDVKDAYGEYTDTGETKNPAEIAEEKLAALSDFMRQNDLQADRTLHNKLFGRFQKYNDGSGQIRTGKDVFDMITSYNQSFKTGELTGLTKAVAEGTVKFDRKSKKPVNLNKTKPNNVRKSLTKSEKQQIEDSLNKTPGPKGPDGNYLMSQKDWQADKDRGLSKAVTMAMDGTLDGLIVDKMAQGDTIHGLSRDEFMKRVYTKLGMHVYNFNPKVNNSLFGWINTYLGNRVGDVANQAKRQKAPAPIMYTSKKIGDEGGRTVAETIKGDDADTIIAAVDATMNKQDVAIDNLRTRLGIEKGGPLYNKVLAAVEKTFGRTKLKDISNIQFKQDLKNKFNTELFKAVKNSLGTRAAYKNFIEGDVVFKNKDGKEVKMPRIKMLFDYFSQEIFNKRFEQFKEKLIDPSTGKQARPENNPLFRKKDNITKKELVDYFLGADVQASTKGTRKDALASAIAQELAFDATMEVLEDPNIQNKIKDFYELQGLRQSENFLEKVGKVIDRKPGSKFSKSKIKGQVPLRQDQVITEVKNLNEFLNNKEQDIRDGKDLSEIIDSYINKQTPQVKEALGKYVSKLKQIASKHKNTPITLDTFKQLREGGPEGTLKFVSSMPAFIKDQANIENFELKTEAGTEQYFDFITELTSIMDPSFTDSSIFKSTIGRGGKKIFYDSKTGGVKRLNTNEANNIISKGKKQKLKFDPKKAIAISSAQYNKIDSLMKSYTVDQRNDPKIQKKIAKQITDILGKEKMEAIQAARDYLYSKLNEYVQSQKTPAARNRAIANVAKLLEIQSSLTSGIPRQGAVPTTISLNFSEVATKKKRDGTEVPKLYHKEHNLPQVVFNANVLASIIDGNFDQVYPQISKTYNQSILDTDIQLAQDYGLVSKEFYAKYPSAQLINTGRTAEMTGYEMGMDSEALFVIATGNAQSQLDLKTGLTLDKVIYNKLGANDVLSYIGKVADMINKDLSKAPMSKTILDPKNKEAIFSSKENSDLFNEIITNSVNDQSIDNQTIELGIKLENKENYDQRDKVNNDQLNNSGVTRRFSKSKNTTQDVINESTVLDKALDVARDPNAPVKKIRVFDFDDTLARTKSNVFYTMPDGTKGTLTAEQFAEQGDSILEQGGEFDFSDFNKVRDGKPGPLLDVAKKIQAARGTQDVFVLTARAPESQRAIKKFLDEVGLNIPIENITGLGNSTGAAKANWIVNKAAEGYNDFYFADDAIQNVDAVKKALSVIDVKSKVQQAKIKFSKTVDQTVNDMIEHKFGIKSEAEYGDVKARLVGRKKGRFKLFIPPSAEDFVGLLYSMLGKGEVGNMQMDFFKEHLIEPYGRAMENLSRDQNRIVNDFKALKAQLVEQGLIPKNLNKKAVGKFTVQDVSRILAWDKQGIKVPGLTKTDLAQIKKYAKDNPAIDVFAQNLIDINKGDGYAAPNENWLAGTISTDLLDGLRTGKRSKYLKQWKENVDIIFSQKNLNKMEAAMGSNWREAMEDMLRRMESGQNRSSTAGRLENRLLDYINNSVGTVMFFNMRSALLQTISSINFIDFGSNNIFKAAAAFANQKQYWKDFMTLMNSEFLVERRNGLKLNVSESEIADAAATSKNKAKAAIAYILKKGYLPTQFADSFAIASGGATFYRNKIKDLMKKNPDMTLEQAETQAFQEFREIAEESQQSSRPDRISQQQASTLGRLILAFQNTPMQMNRLGKKSFLDLVNRRKKPGMTQFQSDMSNISRVGYYMAVQSLIFSSLQQALFAIAFDDEEPEDEKERYYNVANGVINTILNGTGIIGVSVSTLISVARKVYKESAKEGTFPGPAYEDAANEMLNFSPPIDIKLSKLRQAGLTWKYEGYKHDEANWGIDDPAWKSAAYTISGLTNIPLDRLLNKAENVRSAVQDDWETWQRVSLLLGWSKYQLQSKEDRAEEREAAKDEKAAFRKRIKDSKTRKYFYKQPLTIEEEAEKQQKEKDQKEFDKYKKMNKPRQVEILDSLGLTKKQIRNLKYEKDRVAKIIQLMNQ